MESIDWPEIKLKAKRVFHNFALVYLATVGGWPTALRVPVLQVLTLAVLVGVVLLRLRQWSPVNLAILGIFTALGISSVWAVPEAEPLIGLAQWATILIGGLLAANTDQDRLEKITGYILAGYCALALAQIVICLARGQMVRVSGGVWNPNNLAFILLAMMALAIKRRDRLALIIALVLMLFTGSRVNWAAVGVGVAYLVMISPQIRRYLLRPLPLLAGVGLAGGGLFYYLSGPMMDATMAGRIAHWQTALTLFKEHPLTGSGPWSIYGSRLARPQLQLGDYVYAHVHNLPLNLAAESGALGLVALAGLVIVIAWQLFKHKNHIATAFVLALGFSCLGDYYFWVPATGVLALYVWHILTPDRRELRPVMAEPPALVSAFIWLAVQGHDFRGVLY